MALEEQDREDILREATALIRRMELQLPGHRESWVIGFRRDGAASLFIGQDPVYQFNAQRELRRAYQGGRLIKAERGRLWWLDRRRTREQVHLIRSEFTDEETASFRDEMQTRARELYDQLGSADYRIVGQVPEQADVALEARTWLGELLSRPLRIAASPRVSR